MTLTPSRVLTLLLPMTIGVMMFGPAILRWKYAKQLVSRLRVQDDHQSNHTARNTDLPPASAAKLHISTSVGGGSRGCG